MAMTLRPPEALHEQLKTQAETEGVSIQSLCLKALQEYLDRHSKTVALDSAVATIRVQYADALRRLGE